MLECLDTRFWKNGKQKSEEFQIFLTIFSQNFAAYI